MRISAGRAEIAADASTLTSGPHFAAAGAKKKPRRVRRGCSILGPHVSVVATQTCYRKGGFCFAFPRLQFEDSSRQLSAVLSEDDALSIDCDNFQKKRRQPAKKGPAGWDARRGWSWFLGSSQIPRTSHERLTPGVNRALTSRQLQLFIYLSCLRSGRSERKVYTALYILGAAVAVAAVLNLLVW
jgi:hypothetical protein